MVKKRRRKPKDAMDRVTDLDLATAIFKTQKSPHAQDVDKGSAAEITPSIEVWASDIARWDFRGVDTPNDIREPKRLNTNRALRKARKRGLI